MSSLLSRNKRFVKAVINYVEVVIRVFCPYPILLGFFTLFQIFPNILSKIVIYGKIAYFRIMVYGKIAYFKIVVYGKIAYFKIVVYGKIVYFKKCKG